MVLHSLNKLVSPTNIMLKNAPAYSSVASATKVLKRRQVEQKNFPRFDRFSAKQLFGEVNFACPHPRAACGLWWLTNQSSLDVERWGGGGGRGERRLKPQTICFACLENRYPKVTLFLSFLLACCEWGPYVKDETL